MNYHCLPLHLHHQTPYLHHMWCLLQKQRSLLLAMKNFLFKHRISRYHLLLKGASAFIQRDIYSASVDPDFYQNQARMKSEHTEFCVLQNWNIYHHCKWHNLLYFQQSKGNEIIFFVDFLNQSLYLEKMQKTSRTMTQPQINHKENKTEGMPLLPTKIFHQKF